ncbi:MAG TPA: rhodanese-like domain-containing protein [Lacipirellulaceae bacterium]|jgi:rhodanese-related sulfurtransferase|nr:rhodanese-like domain-containing protein [Lacipirellulaceae bacterium]
MSDHPRFKNLADDAKTRVPEITPKDAAEQQAKGATLIDVREDQEFAKQHAKGAIHLSKGVLEWKIEDTVPDVSTPIICYCGGGSRSALAADNLMKMGYKNVSSLAAGFRGWQEAGLPTE